MESAVPYLLNWASGMMQGIWRLELHKLLSKRKTRKDGCPEMARLTGALKNHALLDTLIIRRLCFFCCCVLSYLSCRLFLCVFDIGFPPAIVP